MYVPPAIVVAARELVDVHQVPAQRAVGLAVRTARQMAAGGHQGAAAACAEWDAAFDRAVALAAGASDEVLELASRQSGASRQHVPGTAYHYKHGYIPLTVQAALLHGKKKWAKKLHAEGAPYANTEPAWWVKENPHLKHTIAADTKGKLGPLDVLPGPSTKITKAKKSGKHIAQVKTGKFVPGQTVYAELPDGSTGKVKVEHLGKEFPKGGAKQQYAYTSLAEITKRSPANLDAQKAKAKAAAAALPDQSPALPPKPKPKVITKGASKGSVKKAPATVSFPEGPATSLEQLKAKAIAGKKIPTSKKSGQQQAKAWQAAVVTGQPHYLAYAGSPVGTQKPPGKHATFHPDGTVVGPDGKRLDSFEKLKVLEYHFKPTPSNKSKKIPAHLQGDLTPTAAAAKTPSAPTTPAAPTAATAPDPAMAKWVAAAKEAPYADFNANPGVVTAAALQKAVISGEPQYSYISPGMSGGPITANVSTTKHPTEAGLQVNPDGSMQWAHPGNANDGKPVSPTLAGTFVESHLNPYLPGATPKASAPPSAPAAAAAPHIPEPPAPKAEKISPAQMAAAAPSGTPVQAATHAKMQAAKVYAQKSGVPVFLAGDDSAHMYVGKPPGGQDWTKVNSDGSLEKGTNKAPPADPSKVDTTPDVPVVDKSLKANDPISQKMIEKSELALKIKPSPQYLSENAAAALQKAIDTEKPHYVTGQQGAWKVSPTAPANPTGEHYQLRPDGTEWVVKPDGTAAQVPPATVSQHLTAQFQKNTLGEAGNYSGMGPSGGSDYVTTATVAKMAADLPDFNDIDIATGLQIAGHYKANVSTKGSHGALQSYTGSGYAGLNTWLRTGKGSNTEHYQQQVKQLDKLFDKYQLPAAVVVKRGLGGQHFPKGPFEPGTTFTDHGYVSTSYASGFGGDIRMEITVPKGMNAISVDGAGGGAIGTGAEKEIILPRGTRFVVESDETVGGVRKIKAVALPPADVSLPSAGKFADPHKAVVEPPPLWGAA